MPMPKHKFDAGKAYAWGLVAMSQRDMAAIEGVDRSTIEAHLHDPKSILAKNYWRGVADGNQSLRAKQHRMAIDGHPTMLIWLGKQRLGQADKREIEVNERQIEEELGKIAVRHNANADEVRQQYLRIIEGRKGR